MARGVSEAEVFTAADLLMARGERPTIERVRRELGRGSPNTVNRMMDAWWASLAQRLNAKETALPPSLIELCGRLYTTLKGEAEIAALRTVKDIQDDLQQREAALAADRLRMETERAGIKDVVNELRKDLGAASRANSQAIQAKASLEAEVMAERHKATQATREATIAADERMKAEKRLQTDIDRLRAQSEAAQDRWAKEIDRLRDEIKRLKGEGAAKGKAAEARLDRSENKVLELENALGVARMASSAEREARIAAEARLAVQISPIGKRAVQGARTARGSKGQRG